MYTQKGLFRKRGYNTVRTITLKTFLYVILITGLIITFAPFYWMAISSLRHLTKIFSEPSFIPESPGFDNYLRLLKETGFGRWFLNSSITALGRTGLALFFCSLGGFAFAKYQFPGKRKLFLVVLASMTIPQVATIIPVFSLMFKLGLLNTYWALILPGSANAFGIFLMRQYILQVPDEILDAGRIDGCSEIMIYLQMILPIIRPALAALAIFMFLDSWQSFLWPLVMMQTPEMYTITVGFSSLFGEYVVPYDLLMAGAVLSVLPIIVVFIFMQKQFMSGLVAGAIR